MGKHFTCLFVIDNRIKIVFCSCRYYDAQSVMLTGGNFQRRLTRQSYQCNTLQQDKVQLETSGFPTHELLLSMSLSIFSSTQKKFALSSAFLLNHLSLIQSSTIQRWGLFLLCHFKPDYTILFPSSHFNYNLQLPPNVDPASLEPQQHACISRHKVLMIYRLIILDIKPQIFLYFIKNFI